MGRVWKQKTQVDTNTNTHQRFYYIPADGKMRKAHRSSRKCLHVEDESEEWTARHGRWYQDRPAESSAETAAAGRNPESRSSRREWDVMAEDDDEGMAGSSAPTYSQVLQGRSNKSRKSMTCPPVIVSDSNHHRFPWEDKPVTAMKITKRRRCKRNKDAPPDASAHSGLTSDASLVQDGHRSEDGGTNAANELETRQSWTGGVNLREEDAPETAETKTRAKGEEANIRETQVQQQNDMDVEDHEDSGTWDWLEDKNQEVIIKNNISEMESCKRGLQEYRQRVHQRDDRRNALKVKSTNFESRVQQQTEDKQQLSHTHDASQGKVLQLEEHTGKVNSKITIHEMLVILLEDEKTEGTGPKQSFLSQHQDLLHQIKDITDKEEKMQMQPYQLQQQDSRLEDICGGLKKKMKMRFPSIFFSKASKVEKEAMAETEAETEMTGGEVKKKRRKWFPLIFFSKVLKMEKEEMAEAETTEGEDQRGAFVPRC